MAIRTKTIEYSLVDSRSIGASITRSFDPLIVYIPETGSRSFRSCFLDIFAQDNVPTATTITGWKFMSRVGTGTPISRSTTVSITNTGENMSFVWTHDVTPEFSSSFGATSLSNSFQFGMVVTGSATSNASAKLYCTYDYDDTGNTRVKTITIPMDSYVYTASATGSGRLIDTIPSLNTYLPEANKVYRDISFEMWGNDGLFATGSAVAGQISASYVLDNNTHGVSGSGPIITTQVSARYFRYIWNQTQLDTSTTHSLYIKTQNASILFPCIAAACKVTYEYDHAASDKVMNCIALSAADDSGFMGGPSSSSRSRFSREFMVQEPQVTMSRCGIYHSFIDSGQLTFVPSVTQSGYTQSVRSYNIPAIVTCGGWVLGTRFDAGSLGGQGMNVTRGKNTLINDWYRTSSAAGSIGSNYSAIAYINYESGKSSQSGGDANHAQIRRWFYSPVQTFALRTLTTSSISLAESASYWLTSLGLWLYTYQNLAGSNIAFVVNTTGSDEGNIGQGWNAPYAGTYTSDAEIGPMWSIARMRDLFRKYPNDPDTTLLIPTRNRFYSVDSSTAIGSTGHFFATYHTFQYTLTGSISGSTGDGSGVQVNFHRSDNDEEVANATTVAGGSFNRTWYDNTIPLYAVARQDDTHVGRSANSTASGTP